MNFYFMIMMIWRLLHIRWYKWALCSRFDLFIIICTKLHQLRNYRIYCVINPKAHQIQYWHSFIKAVKYLTCPTDRGKLWLNEIWSLINIVSRLPASVLNLLNRHQTKVNTRKYNRKNITLHNTHKRHKHILFKRHIRRIKYEKIRLVSEEEA